MATRTIPAWLRSVGVMLAVGAMSASGAFGQESFPVLGDRPMPRSASCPQGNCVTRTWSPIPGASAPMRSGVQRVFGTARPTYQVAPLPMTRPSLTAPSSNRESPFYEYREAPARVRVRPQQPVSQIKNSESPFYP